MSRWYRAVIGMRVSRWYRAIIRQYVIEMRVRWKICCKEIDGCVIG